MSTADFLSCVAGAGIVGVDVLAGGGAMMPVPGTGVAMFSAGLPECYVGSNLVAVRSLKVAGLQEYTRNGAWRKYMPVQVRERVTARARYDKRGLKDVGVSIKDTQITREIEIRKSGASPVLLLTYFDVHAL